MALGMTYEEYWERDPFLVKYYREAHLIKIEQRNQELWMQGIYIYNAMSTVFANIFAKKGTPKSNYLEKPIRLTPLSKEEKRIEAERAKAKIIAELTAWEKRFKKQYPEGKGGVKNGNHNGRD